MSRTVKKSAAMILVAALMVSLLAYVNTPTVEAALKKPAAPKSVQAYPAGSNGIKVTWKKVAGASGYRIYRSTKKSGGFKTIKKLGASKSSYTNTGLKTDARYYYKVRAYTKKGGKTKWSSYSSAKSAVVGAKGLAAYGLKPSAKLNKGYTYKTICLDNTSKFATGIAKFVNYVRQDNGDGYDTISLDITVRLSGDNVRRYGFNTLFSVTDYYLYTKGGKYADLLDGKHLVYSLEYNGETYDECSASYSFGQPVWKGKTMTLTDSVEVVVPHGYDGIVVWVARHPGRDGMERDLSSLKNLLMFRCN